MAEETKSPTPVTTQTAPSVKVEKPITPWVLDAKKLKGDMLELLKGYKPDGNPDKVQLENAKSFAQAEVAALPEDSNLVSVKIEAQARPNFRQTNIMIWHEKI